MKLTVGLVVVTIFAASCLAFAADTVQPLAMNNKAIGGGDIAGTPTKGVENGTGLHNIGLLIKTWGKVTYRDPGGKFFYIDDGAGLKDGTKNGSADVLGVRVSIDNLASGNSIALPAKDSYVSVVGIVSTFMDASSKVRANLRPRNQPDMVTLSVTTP